MLISKKELLNKAKISYGQLYRWKRKKLIPEEWFIKKSSYTGQETYFPEEKILKRIELIKNLKDKHSLEEIAKIISPEISNRHFTKEDLNIIEEIDEEFLCTAVSTFERESFSYIELLLLISISELKKERNLSKEEVSDILAGIKDYDNNLRSTAYLFMVFDRDYYTTLLQEGTEIIVDSRLKVLKKVNLNELSNKIKIKYKKNFKLGGV